MAVAPATSTYAYIEQKIRHLTASASEASLPSSYIQSLVNLIYTNDFPNSIKTDQLRTVYKFITIPNVDRYPVDANNYQGFRGPVYFEGRRGNFFKNRDQLFNIYPRTPTQYQIGWEDLPFTFSLFSNTQNPFPQNNFGILSGQLVIGGIDVNGNPIRIIDDGGANVNANGIGNNTTMGNLIFINNNNVGDNVYLSTLISPVAGPANVQYPAVPPQSPLGGGNKYYNPNYPSYPPSPLTPQYCGTVNYITTEITITSLPFEPQESSMMNVWACQYQTGFPYNLLWWNNEFTIRPVPDNVYMCEVEAYMTPIQFMQNTDDPQLKQWAQYIAYLVAQEILRERQDFEGVAGLEEGRKRQEALVLEKQACEEIGVANTTMFNSTDYGYGGISGISAGW